MKYNTKIVTYLFCLLLVCTNTRAFLLKDEQPTKLVDGGEIGTQVNSMRNELHQLTSAVHRIQTAVNQITNTLETNFAGMSYRPQLCPDGWTEFAGECYFYSVFRKTWNDAHSTCENFGSHLATIDTKQEDGFIEDFIHKSKSEASDWYQNYTWLGGFDSIQEGHWLWVTGKPINMSLYTNWRGGGPNNGRHGKYDEDCMDWSGGGWNDNNCHESFNFVCEKSI